MDELMKNIEKAVPLKLAEEIAYAPAQVISKTLSQRPNAGMTLMAFDEGCAISTHAAGGDALAYVLEGTGEFTIDGVPNQVSAGSCIVMPVGIPHAVKAVTRFKMLLVVIK